MEPMSAEHVIGENLVRIKQEVQSIPQRGTFEERSIEFPCHVDRYSAIVQVTIGPWILPLPQSSLPDWRERRCLDVRVCRHDRQGDSSSIVFSGTKEEIKMFLDDVKKAVQSIHESVKGGVRELKRDEDEEWGKRNFPSPR